MCDGCVLRSGDQNWVSVSRTMKQAGEPGRPQVSCLVATVLYSSVVCRTGSHRRTVPCSTTCYRRSLTFLGRLVIVGSYGAGYHGFVGLRGERR